MMNWKRQSSISDETLEKREPSISSETEGEQPIRETSNAHRPAVEGERDLPSINTERSLRARLNNLFAIGTMLLVGGGFLTWYYAATLTRQSEGVQQVERARAEKAAAEMKLPPLKGFEPAAASANNRAEVTGIAGTALGPPPPLPDSIAQGTSPPVAITSERTIESGEMLVQPSAPPPPSPAELELARRLSSSVLYRPKEQEAPVLASPLAEAAPREESTSTTTDSARGLGNYLTPTATPSVAAQLLSSRRFVLPKGNFIDCTLETAIDSQLPGLVTCVTAFDIFGADGKVVLIERGSKLVGESKGEAQQGMNRIFVVWTEARTPNGVVVQLSSPGTDALGRSGLPGQVNTHFWERFGAAILISVIDGGVQAAVESQRLEGSGSSVTVAPQTSRDIMTETLRNTINIPPTIVKNQGDRIQIIVARDVDFRRVYELRAVGTH